MFKVITDLLLYNKLIKSIYYIFSLTKINVKNLTEAKNLNFPEKID